MSYEAIPFPTGQSSGQIYNWATATSVALRRILQDVTGGSDVDLAALASDVTDLQAQTASLQSQIDGLVANGDLTPQQAFELSLVTRADAIFGSYTNIRNRQQTQLERAADSAMAAAMGANTANTGIQAEVKVRADADQALAQQINSVSANLGVTNANVTQLTQAVADGDAALATQITGVSSQVAGNTTAITQTISSVNGILSRYAVVINAQGEQVGWFKMDGSQQGTVAAFNVDFFTVGKAGTPGGTPVQAFAIQIVNGLAQIALRGEVIADGAISARTVAAGAITADKISANSLSAISADLGTVTAGLIQNGAATLKFDLPNMRIYRPDGKFDLNASANTFVMKP